MSKDSSTKRVLEILKDLNEGKTVNITNLSYKFEVSDRTVRRDLDLISSIYPDFLIKDKENYSAVQKNVLNDILKGTDLATLVSVVNIFKSSGVKFNLDDNIKKVLKESNEVYQFTNKPFEELKNKEVVSKLEKAIAYRQWIEIEYKTLKGIQKFNLKPYKIVLLNENFYLCSEIEDASEFKFSRIGLIDEVKVLSTTFYHRPEIKNFITKAQTPWATYKHKQEEISVVLHAEKRIAKYFKMKKYLPSQEIIEEKEDGSIILEYKVFSLGEIFELIIKWLPGIKILEPSNLKEIIRKQLEKKLKVLD